MNECSNVYEDETVLNDNFPVYGDYLYVVDGRVECSDVFGTVKDLRRDLILQGRTANEVRRCNVAARRAALAEIVSR